jgi:TolB-like protein
MPRKDQQFANAISEKKRLVPLALPDKPSIAVLPFQNMSGDPEQDYFADGMVEDIVTGLAADQVIARNSSFAYRGRAVDIRQVGRELGVRYVLEGSVRKAGAGAPEFEITPEMIEAGISAYLKTAPMWDIDGDYLPSIFTEVYRAMLIASRR